MRVSHFCTYPGQGGAGIVAQRIATGQKERGMDSELFGLSPNSDSRQVSYSNHLPDRLWRRYRKFQLSAVNRALEHPRQTQNYFGTDLSTFGRAVARAARNSDVVHLHWVADLVDYGATFSGLPKTTKVVWTLHDMLPFTGGCSHAFTCEGFRDACGLCPQLLPHNRKHATLSLQRKATAIQSIAHRVAVVGPSKWITDKAKLSTVMEGTSFSTIPNGIDLKVFRQSNRNTLRTEYGISTDSFVVLFVAANLSNTIKGLSFLVEGLQPTAQATNVCFIGTSPDSIPSEWTWLGEKHTDAEMAEAYSIADLLVVPSLAENFPTVICEALACGLPVAASRVGGIPEILNGNEVGFLFEAANACDLRQTVHTARSEISHSRDAWARRCRAFAEKELGMSKCLDAYTNVYDSLG